MTIEVLVFDGCPHAESALELVRRVTGRLAPQTVVKRVEVGTPEHATAVGFLGSPSIRVNGRDIEGRRTGAGTLCCRTYDGAGLPPEWLVETAIARATKPSGVLFLCVANSARSQMAEGIARSLDHGEMKFWSAGSRSTTVRPEAIAVLREIGIDISGHRSKDVADIPAEEVDLVVTLCAEEECPVFLGTAMRLHWGLSDPGSVQGPEEARLAAFRQTRDELRRRIAALFSPEK